MILVCAARPRLRRDGPLCAPRPAARARGARLRRRRGAAGLGPRARGAQRGAELAFNGTSALPAPAALRARARARPAAAARARGPRPSPGTAPRDWAGAGVAVRARAAPANDSARRTAASPRPPARLPRRARARPRSGLAARRRSSGLGFYELAVDSARVAPGGADAAAPYLAPPPSSCASRTHFDAIDVTAALRGAHATLDDVTLGCASATAGGRAADADVGAPQPARAPRGRRAARRRTARRAADGAAQTLAGSAASGAWRVGATALLRNNLYLGTRHDARYDGAGGWARAVAYAPSTARARPARRGPGAARRAARRRAGARARGHVARRAAQRERRAARLWTEFAGVPRSCSRGAAAGSRGCGTERCSPTARPPPASAQPAHVGRRSDQERRLLRPVRPAVAEQRDEYVLGGGGATSATVPKFTWHGFRYAEIGVAPARLRSRPTTTRRDETRRGDAALGRRHSARDRRHDGRRRRARRVRRAGRRSCAPAFWRGATHLSNIFGMQSDCPHERLVQRRCARDARVHGMLFGADVHEKRAPTLTTRARSAIRRRRRSSGSTTPVLAATRADRLVDLRACARARAARGAGGGGGGRAPRDAGCSRPRARSPRARRRLTAWRRSRAARRLMTVDVD